MTLLFTVILTVLLQRNTRLLFFCCCSLCFFDTERPRYDLVLRTHGFVPFPFGKDGSGVLANCSLYGTEVTLFFSAGPACSSFSAKLAPSCKLFAGFGSTNKLSLCFLHSVLSSISWSSAIPHSLEGVG